MADFSIKSLTTPFIPSAHRCFDKATRYIIHKHPRAIPAEVKHDLQVLTFNTASAIMASTIGLAYFKTLSLVAAFALATLFYLVRRIINETMVPLPPPNNERSSLLKEVANLTSALIPQDKKPATTEKTMKEKIKSTFHQGGDIVIGSIVILKLTHQPLPRMINMIFTRT